MAVIKDVARQAGVAVGSVSKYLNNRGALRPATRARIEKAIRELDYRPSPLARSMRTGRTHTLAVIVPDILNPFFAEAFSAIRTSAQEAGYASILYTTADDPALLTRFMRGEVVHPPEGIILCFTEETLIMKQLETAGRRGIPPVLISWHRKRTGCSAVSVDVTEGIRQVAEHVLKLGRRPVAYIGGPEDSLISREKLAGFLKAAEAHRYRPDAAMIRQGRDYAFRTGYEAAMALDSGGILPGAVVAANDALAFGCMKYLIRAGYRIPGDVAVTGFDNVSLSAMYEPDLTTVTVPLANMSREAVRILAEEIREPGREKQNILMETTLVIRKSTVL